MASSIQYHEHAGWSCLPSICGSGQPSVRNGPNPSQARQTRLDRNEMKQTEDLLASQLSKLSVQERAKAFDDVHCVGEELQETPEMIEKSLAEFEKAVQKQRNDVYDMAWNQNRAYLEDTSFRLKFLRANLHNANKSVRQMMRFLRHKATYFGVDKVTRDITLADLSDDDLQVLGSGFVHLQEERDQTGRIIMHLLNTPISRLRVENVIRMLHIIFMRIIVPDPSTQMKGFAWMYHDVSKPGENPAMPGFEFMLKLNDWATSIPIRYSALHYSLQAEQGKLSMNNTWLKYMINLSPDYVKARCRIHIGSYMENRYQVKSHGIPMESYPLDINGNIREDIWLAWFYKYQQEQSDTTKVRLPLKGDTAHSNLWDQQGFQQTPTLGENFTPNVQFTISESVRPTENDILLGRGRFAQTWPGNVRFRSFVEEQLGSYDKIPKNERQKRTIELTEELTAKGIRFFEQKESGEWFEADRTEARKRISQLFRSLRKKKRT